MFVCFKSNLSFLILFLVDVYFLQYLNAAVSSAESRNLIRDNTICVEASAVIEDVKAMRDTVVVEDPREKHAAEQRALLELQEEEEQIKKDQQPAQDSDPESDDPSWNPPVVNKGKGKRGELNDCVPVVPGSTKKFCRMHD